MTLLWIPEECLRCVTAYIVFFYVVTIIFKLKRLLEAGHLKVCYRHVLVALFMLRAAQWQKSPGVFMRKKNEKFTIENGILIFSEVSS